MAPTPRDAKGQLEDSRAGELATYLQENLEAMQLASELAQQEMHGARELVRPPGEGRARRAPLPGRRHTQPRPPQLREKSQALEVSVAELVRQVKDLSDHFLALRWRLDLQEQTLSMRLQEASVPDRRGPASPATGLTALGPELMGSTEWPAQQPPPRGSLCSFSNSFIEVQGTHQSTFSECEFRGSLCVLSCTSTTMVTSRTSPSPLKETPCVRRHSQPQASTDLLPVCGSARSRCFT